MNQSERISEPQENQVNLAQAKPGGTPPATAYDPAAQNWNCQWQDYKYGSSCCTLEEAIEGVINYIYDELETLESQGVEMPYFSSRLEEIRSECIATGEAKSKSDWWGISWMGGTEE